LAWMACKMQLTTNNNNNKKKRKRKMRRMRMKMVEEMILERMKRPQLRDRSLKAMSSFVDLMVIDDDNNEDDEDGDDLNELQSFVAQCGELLMQTKKENEEEVKSDEDEDELRRRRQEVITKCQEVIATKKNNNKKQMMMKSPLAPSASPHLAIANESSSSSLSSSLSLSLSSLSSIASKLLNALRGRLSSIPNRYLRGVVVISLLLVVLRYLYKKPFLSWSSLKTFLIATMSLISRTLQMLQGSF